MYNFEAEPFTAKIDMLTCVTTQPHNTTSSKQVISYIHGLKKLC